MEPAAEVSTLYIQPGAPWQNGYAKSFHSRLRDELLDAELIANLAEALVAGVPDAGGLRGDVEEPSRRAVRRRNAG